MRKYKMALLFLLCLFLCTACGKADQSSQVPDEENTTLTGDEIDFSFSGGSGKVEISCDKVEVKDGQATAHICFDSAYYTCVKIGEESYDAETKDDCSYFTIPVEMNGDTTILATTTRMSTPHDIEYVLSIKEKLGSETAKAEGSASDEASEESPEKGQSVEFTAPEIEGLTFDHTMELSYATEFAVQYYSDGVKLLQIVDGSSFLLLPEGTEQPEGLPDDMTVLTEEPSHIYLAATAVMSLFDSLDSISNIRLSGTDKDGWYVENAVKSMEAGDIVYAGKYSEPDYELLTKEGCDLAIESTMILHSPKIKEMIENLGIPVLVDYSSYESHPLGRSEWIKFYGALLNKEDEADAFFEKQAAVLDEVADAEKTDKTVVYFYLNSDGSAVVREVTDYIPAMIELAGGKYIFSDPIKGEGTATVSMTMEEFYASCVDVDYMIYDTAIEGDISSVNDLLGKSELFPDFKAVKEGNVYSCGKNLYQATATAAELIGDIHNMLSGEDSDMVFLKKID